MREEDIRPAALMERKQGCIERDRAFLLSRRDRFVRVPCPACSSRNLGLAFKKNGFRYERCGNCATVLMNPRPDQALSHAFYASSHNYAFWNEHIYPRTEPTRRAEIFRPRARRVADICAARNLRGGAALEIGAAFGIFGEELAALDLFDRIVALEPTPALAQTCRARGLETVETSIETCNLPAEAFNLVAAFEVLEHLYCPAEFVSAACRLLQPGGLLVLSCPNILGFDVATLGTASNTIDHEHVNYFHPAALRRLLESAQLEVIEVTTPGQLDVDLVHQAAVAGRIDLATQPFLRQVCVDDYARLGAPFQQFLADHRLSGHMWAVARRV